jgi:hypothetical protein
MYCLKKDSWYLERFLYLLAGTLILISIGLALTFSLYWLILTGLVGFNLVIFSLTGFCPNAILFHKLGLKSGFSAPNTK